MNRTGLYVALAIAVVAGLVFGLMPSLDLRVAGVFYAVSQGGNMFAWRLSPSLDFVHMAALRAGFVLLAPFLIALIVKLLLPRRRMLVSPRAAVFLIVSMLLGPGLLVNVALKDHYGRPRPIDIVQFGGTQHFVPWWDPRGDCPSNCSFVSGDVATAAWTFAPAALVPLPWRAAAYAAAFALTAFMAAIRIMAGGHFPSDTIFANVFTYLTIWVCYAALYRWPTTRRDDKTLEFALTRFSRRCRTRLRWLFRRTALEIAGPEDPAPDARLESRRGWW